MWWYLPQNRIQFTTVFQYLTTEFLKMIQALAELVNMR